MNNLQSILDDVCAVFEVNESELKSKNRAKELVAYRMIFSYVAFVKTTRMLKKSSKLICRHHASAINHIKKVTGFLRYNDEAFIKHWNYYLDNSKLFTHYDFGANPQSINGQSLCAPRRMEWIKLTSNPHI